MFAWLEAPSPPAAGLPVLGVTAAAIGLGLGAGAEGVCRPPPNSLRMKLAIIYTPQF